MTWTHSGFLPTALRYHGSVRAGGPPHGRQNWVLYSGADALDSALGAAVHAAADRDIVYADVRGQFAGRVICDSGSWLHSVDFLAISSSYHPTASGQKLGYQPVFSRNTG